LLIVLDKRDKSGCIDLTHDAADNAQHNNELAPDVKANIPNSESMATDSVSSVADVDATVDPPVPHVPYFLRSFQMIVDAVLASYVSLFTQEELDRMAAFQQLSLNARCLFVRMFNRKGPWFPVATLHYEAYMDIPKTLQELKQAGFVVNATSLATQEKVEQS